MSQPQPPQRQSSTTNSATYAQTLHNVALACVITCPLIALLPPRKFGVSTIALGGMTVYSGDYLYRERTGRSFWQYVNASDRQALKGSESQTGSVPEEARQQRQNATMHNPEVLKQEGRNHQADDWKQRRDEEVKDALDVGKGFGDMIVDQVWEVWNWGKKTDDEE